MQRIILVHTSTVSINSSSSPSVSCGSGLTVRLLVGLVSKLLVICRELLQTLCGDVSLDADELKRKIQTEHRIAKYSFKRYIFLFKKLGTDTVIDIDKFDNMHGKNIAIETVR